MSEAGKVTPTAVGSAMGLMWQKQIRPGCYCEPLPEIPCPRHESQAYAAYGGA